MDFWIKAAQLILSLSILVVLHEFGHYLTARYFKIRVEKFYLFFNPWFSLFKKKIGQTEWGIGWLPLGGYVKISGMVDESMDKEQLAKPAQPWEFRSKPAWQRLIVMIGGVVVNILVGILIYIFVLFAWGEEQIPTKNLAAGLEIHPYMEKYDLRSGDNILAINGNEVNHYRDINNGLLIRNQRELKVQRPDGTIETITLPEGIDYELFRVGAFPTVNLRHKSIVIDHLITINENSEINIGTSDFILEFDEKPLSETDFTDLESFDQNDHSVLIKRDSDTLNIELSPEQLNEFLKLSPALASGLKKNDKILSVSGHEVSYFDDITGELYKRKKKSIPISVLRDSDTLTLSVTVGVNGTIGFAPIMESPVDIAQVETKQYSFAASIGAGISRGYRTLGDYAGQLKFLFTKKGASSIGGFGAIGNLFPALWDWQVFWLNTALISIILAFMNILPIPALDGGHVVFLLYEMITGKEAPQKVLEYAQYAGFIFLMGLVLYANGNDIYRWVVGV